MHTIVHDLCRTIFFANWPTGFENKRNTYNCDITSKTVGYSGFFAFRTHDKLNDFFAAL